MPSSIPPLAPEDEAIESVQDRVIDTVTATQQEVLETIDDPLLAAIRDATLEREKPGSAT